MVEWLVRVCDVCRSLEVEKGLRRVRVPSAIAENG